MTQSRRGGVPKVPSFLNAYEEPYLPRVSKLSSSMAYTPSYGGPPTRADAIRKLDNRLIKLTAKLEAEHINPVDIAVQLNTARREGLAIIDHNYPPPPSNLRRNIVSGVGKIIKPVAGIFKGFKGDVVYTIAELTYPHPDRHANMSELMDGLNSRSVDQFTEAFKNDRQNISHITKKPNGDILISYRKTHPLLGNRASFMIQTAA